jgi:hypothetical protein
VSKHPVAPAWQVSQWFNTELPLDLVGLRGRVIALHSFQMVCPGCVLHGVPQAERIHQQFAGEGNAAVGLHTVFEHLEAMQPVSLRAFPLEFRVTHSVGVDAPTPGQRVPATIALCYRSTPTDRRGHRGDLGKLARERSKTGHPAPGKECGGWPSQSHPTLFPRKSASTTKDPTRDPVLIADQTRGHDQGHTEHLVETASTGRLARYSHSIVSRLAKYLCTLDFSRFSQRFTVRLTDKTRRSQKRAGDRHLAHIEHSS